MYRHHTLLDQTMIFLVSNWLIIGHYFENFIMFGKQTGLHTKLSYSRGNCSIPGFSNEIHDELNQPDIKILFEMLMKVIFVRRAIVSVLQRK